MTATPATRKRTVRLDRDVPVSVRVSAAERIIRRERMHSYEALKLKLAAVSPSDRVYLLTGEPAS